VKEIQKTYYPKGNPPKNWILVDAGDKILGRVASEIAFLLRGKHKAGYTPAVDAGDFVVVVNAGNVKFTGQKLTQKFYYSHSGYPNGLRKTSLATLLKKRPEDVLAKAIKGMLPKTKLRLINNVKIFAGSEHNHQAQNPQPISERKPTTHGN
jgi:large subunit ribosomal protein L13